jgi:hypothetical protein
MKLLMMCLLGSPAVSPTSQPPKPAQADSILIRLHKSKGAALDLVLLAFSNAGLTVTNQTGSMVESDQGSSENGLLGEKYSRVVRALVMGNDSASTVLIVGQELTTEKGSGKDFGRRPISNRSRGSAQKVWRKMVIAGAALDPEQLPGGVIKP